MSKHSLWLILIRSLRTWVTKVLGMVKGVAANAVVNPLYRHNSITF